MNRPSWGPASEPENPRHGAADPRGPYHEFARRIRARHSWVRDTPLCACSLPAASCPDLWDAHELFGDHVPWQPRDTRPMRPPAPRPPQRPSPHPTPHPVVLRSPGPFRGPS